jgi:LmbE family N-acetylglucosaminyl deacetylase
MHHLHWRSCLGTLLALALAPAWARAAAPAPQSAAAIVQELQGFRELGSVLYVAAHPDDENSRVITWLTRGRGYRMAYLSLTRGDGGQNLIGPELGEALGVIRTQELLAARRVDGAEQFFSRAIDFGFSKTPAETLAIWDRSAVLGDVVRLIRQYQPDVLLVAFSPQSAGETHGHHTASAILAVEAFKLAGDPTAYPEQLNDLRPWSPRRVVLARWWGGEKEPSIEVDVGGYDPVSGRSFGEIAAASRSMHKSQGMGMLSSRGSSISRFQVIAGEPATKDLLEGIDTTWGRVPGGAAIDQHAAEVLARFDPLRPAASVPALLALRREVAALTDASVAVAAKRQQLDRIVQACLGLYVETIVPAAEVVAGEELKLKHTVIARAAAGVRWVAVRYPGHGAESATGQDLQANVGVSVDATRVLPAATPLSQPYWLRGGGSLGLARVEDASLIGRPENPPVFPVEHVFEIDGQTLVVADEPVQVTNDRVKGEIRRRLEVIAPVALRFVEDVELLAPGATRAVEVELEAARPDTAGVLRLDLPAGWSATPAEQGFKLAVSGEQARVAFSVTAPARVESATIVASAEVGGIRFRNRRVEINYDHIPPLLLQPVAALKAVSVDVAIRGRRVGFVPGAGDSAPDALAHLGYAVTTLADAELTPERLREYDAVVFGIRAFSSRPDLAARLPALYGFVESGGNVIVQYNTPERTLTTFAPLTLRIARNERVTDETATMTLLAPEHPAFTTPNRIGPADFAGWVQERGLYFPTEWDARFTPLLACADPGEPVKNGSLIVAQHGKGYFVYTGLAFFRQLPAGVPGAYRLLANLVSLGK